MKTAAVILRSLPRSKTVPVKRKKTIQEHLDELVLSAFLVYVDVDVLGEFVVGERVEVQRADDLENHLGFLAAKKLEPADFEPSAESCNLRELVLVVLAAERDLELLKRHREYLLSFLLR